MSNVSYFSSGNSVNMHDTANVATTSTLPIGVYVIRQHPMDGPLYLQKTDELHPPSKIYGDSLKAAERIITTFASRKSSTGVLLSGVKGSGKTLLTKIISANLLAVGMPTVIVDQRFDGPKFNELIGKLDDCVVIFDEFDKVFFESSSDDSDGTSTQESLLTLFDGTIESKKLFILSVNDSHRVNEFFRNRPGRIFYTMKFRGLSEEFVREYAQEKLIQLENLDSLIRISGMFGAFTFDMLQALVEEMNRYGETAKQALSWLNFDVADNAVPMTVNMFIDGVAVPPDMVRPSLLNMDPTLTDDYEEVYVYSNPRTKDIIGDVDLHYTLDKSTFQGLKPNGATSYKKTINGKEVMVILERQVDRIFNIDSF